MSNLTKMNFTVYSKSGCPFCQQIIKILELAELKHVVYSLDIDFSRNEFYAEFGENSTFPQVICNDKKLGGSLDSIKYLKENMLI